MKRCVEAAEADRHGVAPHAGAWIETEQVERCTCAMCLHKHINMLHDKMKEITEQKMVAEDRRALLWAIRGHEEETA